MKKEVKRILIIGLMLNVVLTILKISFGYLGNSGSLISDGFNSLSDILISASLLVMVGLSFKKPDKDHPYGHEKYEGIISLSLSFVMILTAVFIFSSGIKNLISYNNQIAYLKPQNITIYVVILSILLKLIIYKLNMNGYEKYHQISLKADAYNHLSDILSTLASLVGIIFSILGYIYIDYIASILIGFLILYSAIKVLKEAISHLVDEAPSKEYNQKVRNHILKTEGIISLDDYKARKHMNKIYIDIEVGVDQSLSLIEAHQIAECLHHNIEKEFIEVIHCAVHVNPKEPS